MTTNSKHTFHLLLDSCIANNRASQKELYKQYYAYAMNICLHYSSTREEASEILNDSFLKVFKKLDQYNRKSAFKSWLRRILINTSIDYFRRYHREEVSLEVIHLQEPTTVNSAPSQLGVDDILQAIQQLPPSYRLVFNLHAVEGYSHPEIAKQIGISVGTSKSNLAKARKKLQNMLMKIYPDQQKIK
ncbi:MAG: RNA polymerase ECF-type sigma factor [Saprospiraceae bacterium]|nr:MAG: RNA polymerase ECF-type sigma factor [Saprospiraceae bacterium]